MMRKILSLCLTALVATTAFAAELQWETDFEKAKQRAEQENKEILINFTGSDWCGWCKRLDREVFSTQTFADFAARELILLKVDFPKYSQISREQQEANDRLARKYGVTGFPAIYLVDGRAKVLLRTGYRRGGSENYIDHLSRYMK
jgi:protein disulfide-isomerase